MSSYDCEFSVIGGSGGIRAARAAAPASASQWCGICVDAGCILKKLFTMTARLATDFREAIGFGWDVVPPKRYWGRLVEHKDRELARLTEAYRRHTDRCVKN